MREPDNLPEISGARDKLGLTGNEPMLTGIYNRVKADRDGAYRAWNHKALIEMMSETQQMRLSQWCLRVALRKAYRALPFFETVYPDDQRPRQALEATQVWMHNPSTSFQAINDLAKPYYNVNSADRMAHEKYRQQKDMVSSKAESAAAAALNTIRAAHSAASGTTLRTTELVRHVSASACMAGLDDILAEWKPTWKTMEVQRRSMWRAIRRAAYMIVLKGE